MINSFRTIKLNLYQLLISSCRYYIILFACVYLTATIFPKCEPTVSNGLRSQQTSSLFALAQQLDVTSKPSIILITPQSFKVPTNPFQGDEHNPDNQTRYVQHVAVINNALSEAEDQLFRQKYPKLSLQIREARQHTKGQIFYEHIFDYFASNRRGQHLLIPVDLDQVSPTHGQSVPIDATNYANNPQYNKRTTNRKKKNDSIASIVEDSINGDPSHRADSQKPQQLVVSIRPHQPEVGSQLIEFVRSAPILTEPVSSGDGRRSFSVVQTDKPVYKPDEKVRIRALVIDENLRPVVRDEFRIQIRNPQQIVVEEIRYPKPLTIDTDKLAPNYHGLKHEPLFFDHILEFPPEPMQGIWSVHLLHSDPIANDTTTFEVKEYVLPPYEISFDLPKYILPSTTTIAGSITAKYHYGKPVQSKVQFKFGYNEVRTKYIARSSIKTIDPITGRVDFRIGSDKFKETEWFPSIAGSRLVVEATVTEGATGHRETAQDTSCVFVTFPYRISFEHSISDFKSDLSQKLVVQLIDSFTNRPGPAGEKIIASYFDKNKTSLDAQSIVAIDNKPLNVRDIYDTEAVTDNLGRAIFNVGPVRDDLDQIHVSFKLLKNRTDEVLISSQQHQANLGSIESDTIELASGFHVLNKYDSRGGWIYLMNKTATHLNVGDEFVSDVLIQEDAITRRKIYYTITTRGQIVGLNTLDADGLVRFMITESMVPSIRLVLFLLKEDQKPLSDSIRVNVNQDVNCGVSLEYESENRAARYRDYVAPNDAGKLLIKARPGDLVSLIGVDSAVYTLNKRTLLDSMRIIERIKRLDTGCGSGGGLNDLDVFHNAGLMVFNNNVSHSTEPANSFIGSFCLTLQGQLKYLDDAQMGYSKPMFTHLSRLPNIGQIQRHNVRTKRDVEVESMLRRYKNPIHRACCKLGTLEDSPHHRNCSVRAKIVQKYMHQEEFKSCAQIYQTCCYHVFRGEIRYGSFPPIIVPRRVVPLEQVPHYAPDFNIGRLDQIESHTLIRKDFRETWLFDLVFVPDQSGVASIDVQMPHTITSWSITAMALNHGKPMCIMPKPYRLTTYQEIFIQVVMPYKLIQGEQIDLVTKIFNYSPYTQDVLVYMFGIEDVCSEAEPGERSERKRVRVEKHSTQSVLFSMIPLKTGKFPIRIVAVALTSNSSDIVERQLNVVPRGKPVTDETTFSLDPLNQQRRGKRAIQTGNLVDEIDSSRALQRSRVRLMPSRDSEHIVPQTQECIVSVIGDKLGQAVQTTILDVENLIRLPHGCGEQVMIYLGPTLYTAHYLSSMNRLIGETRWRAIRYIQSGYRRILNFRKENGAFSAFAHRDPSIWLTAFVTKLLCQTELSSYIASEVHVDKNVINSALRWLLDAQNKTSGEWTEWNPVYHREMLGGTFKQNVLTAFVVVTLNECAHHSFDLIDEPASDNEAERALDLGQELHGHRNEFNKMKLATQQAEQMLILNRYNALRDRNPFVLALVAYALSSSNPQESVSVLNDLMSLSENWLSRNQIFWRGDHQIETAAYALQAIIATAPYAVARDKSTTHGSKSARSLGAEAISIANWLSSRRSFSGAFESTQDTVVALEALSKLAQLQASPVASSFLPQVGSNSLSLTCNVTVSNRTRRSIEFGEANAQIMQSFKIDSFVFDSAKGETLDITTSGSGLGTMSIKLKYNVFQEEDELCRFNIDSSIEEWHPLIVKSSNDKSTREDNHGVNEPPIEDQTKNDTENEDEYFRTFDRSMLNELNLNYDSGQIESNGQQPAQADNKRAQQQTPILRLKRSRATRYKRTASDASALARVANDPSESWTTKIVSTLRSRLPSWIGGFGDRHSSLATNHTRGISDRSTEQHRRNSTSRRSAQSMSVPLVNPTTIMPTGVHLNTLSRQFDIGSENKNSSYSNNSSRDLSNRLVLLLRICVHHMARRDSEMAVIEVGVLSGFKPNEADLKEIINDTGTPAMKYELSPDRSLVIIYMQHIPNSGPFCLQFRLIRDSLVFNLQSGYIRVYEYYSPKHSCSNFYTPSRVTDLIRTKCDSTGQVCQCASRSLCPATTKLVDLGEIYQVNTTNARNQLVNLICSDRFDLVSMVRLKDVKFLEVGQMFKLFVKVKSDLKGNLTKIMDAQRAQKTQLIDNVLKPRHASEVVPDPRSLLDQPSAEEENAPLDLLSIIIDSRCLREEPLLLHLAHHSLWRQGGELILFARSQNLEKRLFKSTAKQSIGGISRAPVIGIRPKPSVWSNKDGSSNLTNSSTSTDASLDFDDVQQLQYSLQLSLDKDTILHDLTYQAKLSPREAIKNLLLWLELRSKREKWSCH